METILNKAKRYDDLLVRLQKAKVDNNVCDDRYCCVINDIVPELKESEDERIGKELIEFVKSRGGFKQEYIAWSEEDKKKYCNTIELLEDMKVLKAKYDLHPLWVEQCNEAISWLKSLKDRVQPKQEWSEEDERRFNNLCFLINQSDENVPTKEGFINWLKSFRHHKHNYTYLWYECIKECVGFKVGNVYNSDGEWIYGDNKKCAYDERFFRPQSHWRPSDEQMAALDGICSYIRNKADWEISQDMVSDLYKLSEQLKKLREE